MDATKAMPWIMVPAVLGFFIGSILFGIQIAEPTALTTVHAIGTAGTALVVYHPGLSSFQADMTSAFVEGLVDSDWRCDITTASEEAPVDLVGYDLLVLGTPTYQWKPAAPIRRYVNRLDGLSGMPTVLLVTGGGLTSRAATVLKAAVNDAGGDVLEAIELWQGAPNEIARRAAADLTLP